MEWLLEGDEGRWRDAKGGFPVTKNSRRQTAWLPCVSRSVMDERLATVNSAHLASAAADIDFGAEKRRLKRGLLLGCEPVTPHTLEKVLEWLVVGAH